jgi:hypothetical protein
MTTTLTSIHDRILDVLVEPVPTAITERLAMLVWELDDLDRSIGNAISSIHLTVDRIQAAHEAKQTLDFEARQLAGNQRHLCDRIADRDTKVQLIMQLLALIYTLTGTDSTVLRSTVFGSKS